MRNYWPSSDSGASSLAASTTRYSPVGANAPTMLRTTEAHAQVPIRTAGFVRALVVRVITGNRNNASCTLRVNASGSALTVSFSAAGTYYVEANVAVASGDLLSYEFTGGSGGNANYTFTHVGVVTGLPEAITRTCPGLDATRNFSAASTTTHFCLGGDLANETSAATVAVVARSGGTARNLAAYITANTRTTDTVIEFYVNGSASGFKITVAGSTTGLVEQTSGSTTWVDGDTLSLALVTGSGSGNFTIQWIAIDLVSNAGFNFHISAAHNGTAFVGNQTRYVACGGKLNSSTTEGTGQFRFAVAGSIVRMGARVKTHTLNVDTTLTTRLDGVGTAQALTIPASTTGWFDDVPPDPPVDFNGTQQLGQELVAVGGSGTMTVIAFLTVTKPNFGRTRPVLQAVQRASLW